MEDEKERLRANLEAIRERIAHACDKAGRSRDSVRLVAVTKTYPKETVQSLIDIGVREIGENRVQEMAAKAPGLKGDFILHMVGHLQTNKAGQALRFASWIQSIDSERLVSRIEQCHAGGEKVKALVEVNTTGEASKSGCVPDQCRRLCERVAASTALELRGLMTIGPLEGDESRVRESFSRLRRLGESVADLVPMQLLSMGMSGDFEWAIEEGSTMIRIGTALAGARPG
ncbi:MAG: YggS family pyridoxal phosphate-dependent enzyme [Chitinispirillaceae bacterium]|nr:YggS family pyridoxal phosphate-dependent enzyme [Chitinispirillaceae bacterium]